MTTLRSQIQEDVKAAMKARDQLRVDTVRGLFAEIRKQEIDTKAELDDNAVTGVVQREVKKRREALEYAEKLDRAELVTQNRAELEILQAYLGQPLTDDELRALISKLREGGADSLGKIMGELNKDYKGRFDGKKASELAKSVLG